MAITENFYTAVFGAGIAMNTVEVCRLYHIINANKWRCPNLYLLNQGTVNLVFSIVAMSVSILDTVHKGASEKELCLNASVLGSLCLYSIVGILQNGSIIATFLLTFDRFIAVIYPLKFRLWRTKRNFAFGIIITWGIAIIFELLTAFASRDESDKAKVCTVKVCPRISISLATVIIGVFMLAMFLKIFRKIRSRRIEQNQLNMALNPEQTKNMRTREQKVLWVACSTNSFFALTTLPNFVLTILMCCGDCVSVECRKFIRRFVGVKVLVDPFIDLMSQVKNRRKKPGRKQICGS